MGVSDLHDLDRNSVQSQDTIPHCFHLIVFQRTPASAQVKV